MRTYLEASFLLQPPLDCFLDLALLLNTDPLSGDPLIGEVVTEIVMLLEIHCSPKDRMSSGGIFFMRKHRLSCCTLHIDSSELPWSFPLRQIPKVPTWANTGKNVDLY